MAVDDIVGLQICGRYQQQNIVNTIHFKLNEQVSDEHDILDSLCAAWEAANKVPWLARHMDTYSLMGLKGFSLTGDNKKPGIVHIDEPGVIVTGECSSALCRTITLYTDSDNYRRRGRVMLSGSSADHFNNDDGAVTDAELVLMAVLAPYLVADLSAGGDTAEPGLAPTVTLPWERFTGTQARKTPAVIRSRRVRGFSIG